MDSKFTPGPWRVKFYDDGYPVVFAGDAAVAKTDCSIHCEKWNGDMNTNAANASLIAAAPEMYEACRMANWLLNTPELKGLLETHAPAWGDPVEITRMLEEALKKARIE